MKMFLYNSRSTSTGRTPSSSRSVSSVSSGRSTSCEDRSTVVSAAPPTSTPLIDGSLHLLFALDCSNDVMCCQFSIDGRHLAVGLTDANIKVFDCNSGQCRYRLTDNDTLTSHLPVTQIRFRTFTPDERDDYMHILIASYASGAVKLWHYTTGTCLHTIDEERQTLSISLNPDRTKFLTAGSDALIHIYDLESRKRLNTCEASDSRQLMDGHRFRIFASQYHPFSQNIFISGGWDDTVQYWDDRKQHAFMRFVGPHICGDALTIDPVHNQVLTGSWRRGDVLQIWDFQTGLKIKDVPQSPYESCLLYCAQWLGDNSIISGGSSQNMAQIHDRATLNITGRLSNLPQSVYCIDNDGIGHSPTLAVGFSHYIYLLKSEPDKRSKMAESMLDIH